MSPVVSAYLGQRTQAWSSVNTPKTTPRAQGRWGTSCQCFVNPKPEVCCQRPSSQSKSQQLSRTEHRIRGKPVPINHCTARYFTQTSPPAMRQVHFMKLETGSEKRRNRLKPMPGRLHSPCSQPSHWTNLLISRQQAKSPLRDLKTTVLLPAKGFKPQRQSLFLPVISLFLITAPQKAPAAREAATRDRCYKGLYSSPAFLFREISPQEGALTEGKQSA